MELSLWFPSCTGTDAEYWAERLAIFTAETGATTDEEKAHDVHYTTGTYGWVKVNSVDDWETKMIDAGVTHHGVMIYDSKVADALEMFCKFMGIRVVRAY